MRGRRALLMGFGAGYVLGAKAGHERYEQLRRLYDNLVSSPTFQDATGKAREAAGTGYEQAKGYASEGASKVSGRSRSAGRTPARASRWHLPPPRPSPNEWGIAQLVRLATKTVVSSTTCAIGHGPPDGPPPGYSR